MRQIGGGHWASFVSGVKDGDQYLFYVDGVGSSGYKRDPRARLLTRHRNAGTDEATSLRLRAGRQPGRSAVVRSHATAADLAMTAQSPIPLRPAPGTVGVLFWWKIGFKDLHRLAQEREDTERLIEDIGEAARQG